MTTTEPSLTEEVWRATLIEATQLLREARQEILQLRSVNQVLAAKVEVMDLFHCVLFTQPAQRNQGMGIDVAFAINKFMEKQGNENVNQEGSADTGTGGKGTPGEVSR